MPSTFGSGSAIIVRTDMRNMNRFVKRWPKAFTRRSLQVVNERVQSARNRFVRQRMTGKPGLKINTGKSQRAIRTKVSVSSRGVRGIVYIDLRMAPHLRIHEIGGTIKPKSSKFLWIPADGSSGKPLRISSFSNMSFLPTPRGFVVLDKGSKKHIYTLVRSVQIPARLGFRAWISRDFSSRTRAAIMVTKIVTLTAFDAVRGRG